MMKLKNRLLKLEKKCSKTKQWNKKNLKKNQAPEELTLKFSVNVYIHTETLMLKNYLKQKKRSYTSPKILALFLHSLMIIWMNVLKILQFACLISCKISHLLISI